jgi:DNA-binding HxlR family transcriptional regulator
VSGDRAVGATGGDATTDGDGDRHPRHRLDPVIHFPLRLSIMACLAPVTEAEFGFVRNTVEISAATLSKQMTVLEEAGYVAVRKGYVGKRPRTWLALTGAGRASLAGHLAALRAIAGDVAPASAPRQASEPAYISCI